MTDRRCRFGLRPRRDGPRRQAGESSRAIARSMACSPTTVTTARDRWQQASERSAPSGLRGAAPRRPVPRSCPWALSADEEQRILDARARTNWGPMRLAALVGRHRATIWKVLKRHGVSRRRRATRQTFRRFEWSQPGALLHIDAYKAPKFLTPGHRVTGDRDQSDRPRGLGNTVVIAVQDDHTRLVYAELHSAENAANVSITLRRAAAWMRRAGLRPGRGGDAATTPSATPATASPDTLRRARRPPHPHPALHAALERQDRTVLRHPRRRMGTRPRLAQLRHPRPRAVIVHPLLQPLAPSQRRRRPTTHRRYSSNSSSWPWPVRGLEPKPRCSPPVQTPAAGRRAAGRRRGRAGSAGRGRGSAARAWARRAASGSAAATARRRARPPRRGARGRAAGRASRARSSMSAAGSPTARSRSGTVSSRRSPGSTSGTSSHSSAHDTRASGVGRTE